MIYVNTRCIHRGLKGARRYTEEILSRLPNSVKRVYPRYVRGQLFGQAWVQTSLPIYTRDGLLWSPTGMGPVVKKTQVLSLHDVSPLDHPSWFTRRYAVWIRAVLPTLIRRVRRVIAVSEFTKRRIVELFQIDPDNVQVIHNGLSEKFYPRPQSEEHRVQQELQLPTDRYLLSLGTLSPRKNTGRLLEAWGQAQQRLGDEWWLVMVGEKGPAHGRMDLDVPDRVLFTGYVDDEKLPALYSGAHAFLYPSLYEGFGLPPLEAMASGTPPLVADKTSLPEVVGNAGVLIDPLNVDDIVEGILKIVQNGPFTDQLRERGLRRAKKFGWDKAARETWKVLREVAQSSHSHR